MIATVQLMCKIADFMQLCNPSDSHLSHAITIPASPPRLSWQQVELWSSL
jgi:hypothetical protein